MATTSAVAGDTMPAKKSYPASRELTDWIAQNAQQYICRSDRKFVTLDMMTSVNCGEGVMTAIRVQFAITRSNGTLITRVLIRDVENSMVSMVEGPCYTAYEKALEHDDVDAISRINVGRYHIYKSLLKMKKYLRQKRDGGLAWYKSVGAYIKPIRKDLDAIIDMRENISLNSSRTEVCCGSIFARKDSTFEPEIIPKEDHCVCSWFKKLRGKCVCDQVEVASTRNILYPSSQLPSAPEAVGRNANGSSIMKARPGKGTELQFVSISRGKVRFEGDDKTVARRVEEEETKATIINDAPCFHVISSSVKSITGYARIHVGGTVPAGFKGKFIPDMTLGETTKAIKDHVAKLKTRNVQGVLLSGTLWSSESRFSGYTLNTALPKCFDGLHVKFLASSIYAEGVAADVRNKRCEIEGLGGVTLHDVQKEQMVTIEEDYVTVPLTESFTDDPDETVVQSLYDECFASNSAVDQEMKMINFHLTPFTEPMSEICMWTSPHEFIDVRATETSEYMKPKVRTHMDMRHPTNQQELVYSVFNRNYLPAKEESIIHSKAIAWDMFMEFATSFKQEPIPMSISDADRSGYLKKKGQSDISEVKRLLNDIPNDIDKWFALVKGTPKPVLEDGSAEQVSPTQVIICKDKVYNAVFGPECSYVKNHVMHYLNDDLFIFSESANEEYEKKINRHMFRRRGKILEIDISKFDKSQGFTSFFFELLVFAYFGMSEEHLNEWYESHLLARIRSMTGTTKFKLPPQRKSGDPWTYYGNTFYLLAALRYTLRMMGLKANYMMLSGDDSVVWVDMEDADYTEIVSVLQDTFSLEAKLIKSNTTYFCSRFLVDVHGFTYLVPDPVKALVKFGKTDMRDRGHVEDVRISLLDHLDSYKYIELREATAKVVADRYGYYHFDLVMEHLYSFACNKDAFHALYYDAENTGKMAIVVPQSVALPKISKIVAHVDLVRKTKSMNLIDYEAYMRAVGKNAGKRILITYSPNLVPQGVRILADLRENFDYTTFKELVHNNYKG